MQKSREYTNRIIKHIENSVLDPDTTLTQLLDWMSEREVRDFYIFHGWDELLDGEVNEEEVDNLEAV